MGVLNEKRCKRFYDLFINIKYTTKTDVKTSFDRSLVSIKKILNMISITWLLYMLIFLKLNSCMTYLLYSILFAISYYFVFEEGYIYYFVDKSKTNKQFMLFLDDQGGIIVSSIFLIIYIYCVYKIVPANFFKLIF